ncbi:hypothetical protein J8I87_28620 [Paraburkholderia sp. LEh10]|uniref:hypothetical protein n=1 Tax=Paraburkholderia sp. LEh10 TaxID=2821353 RepID=UPI001AE6441B|nr:hypothetical protein [Paraburkholderia sp. LEh10]MBP0593586.1 hypothetical protein [Paraburkholderia sp. LEh10]
MSCQSFSPYRGYKIGVHVTPARSHALGGVGRRHRVSWTVSSEENPDREIVSFPEQFEFLSRHAAFRYAESRAHAYIDFVLSTLSQKPMESESSRHAGEVPTV